MGKLLVGIDEVGRGPLAGPVSVGIVVVRADFDVTAVFQDFGLTDSKKMTPRARERVYALARSLTQNGTITSGVFSSSAQTVDAKGISHSISAAISRGLTRLVLHTKTVHILLDGGLSAPGYSFETIIRGDQTIPLISLASVIAKVTRDRYMAGNAHTRFPAYGFKDHKGYGTDAHYAALKIHGPSPLHRRSFLHAPMVESSHE